MSTPLEFDVHGTPIAQGSKRWIGSRMIESSAEALRPWREVA